MVHNTRLIQPTLYAQHVINTTINWDATEIIDREGLVKNSWWGICVKRKCRSYKNILVYKSLEHLLQGIIFVNRKIQSEPSKHVGQFNEAFPTGDNVRSEHAVKNSKFFKVAPSFWFLNINMPIFLLKPFPNCLRKTWFKFLGVHRQNVDQIACLFLYVLL